MESSDSAWEKFKQSSGNTESVLKASLADKLDILASQLNEVVTNTRNVAKLAPELAGDQSAIDAANMMAPAGGMGSGGMEGLPDPSALADELAGQVGGDETMNPEDKMIDEQGAPAGDVPPEMPPEMPPSEEGAAPPMPEEAMPPMPEAPMEEAPSEMPIPGGEVPAAEPTSEMMGEVPPAMDMYNSDVAFEDLLMTLSDEMHEAVDEGNYAKVQALAKKLEMLQATWSGFENAPLSDAAMSTAGAEDMVPPEVIDALAGGAAPELPPEALMKSEKEDEPKEEAPKEEASKGDVPDGSDEPGDDVVLEEEAMVEEEPLPEVDPMVQGLMGLMQILDAGDVEGAKAMIAALLEQAAPVAKSEEIPGGDVGGDAGGDVGGDTEPVAMSEGEDDPSGDVEKACDEEPVAKSEQFHIESISEMMARMNGYDRPSSDSAVGGDIMRPNMNPYAIRKSAVHFGPADNPLSGCTDADWERYKAYKSQSLF